MELISSHACFGGRQQFYRHDSHVIGLPMRFSVYLPPGQVRGALFYLAGLTCNEETFMIKAGAQRTAARLGLVLIAPDTSPRGANLPGEADAWDLGVAASFYLDASQAPWAQHYRMETYLVDELRLRLIDSLGLDPERIGIMGHSMGGHGALTLALRHSGVFASVSALAPIAAPAQCPWGQKAFSAYLGPDQAEWQAHDASALMRQSTRAPYPKGILIDQGLDDKFLNEQLLPEQFEQACQQAAQPLQLHRHAGYDHGYYFVASMIEEHLIHHRTQLAA